MSVSKSQFPQSDLRAAKPCHGIELRVTPFRPKVLRDLASYFALLPQVAVQPDEKSHGQRNPGRRKERIHLCCSLTNIQYRA
jgi:hypothetical protein